MYGPDLSPPLTTFYVPTSEIGARSADHLVSRIEGLSVADHAELDVPFLLRHSTGPAPISATVRPVASDPT
jgi:LacI family transcriptional regulator